MAKTRKIRDVLEEALNILDSEEKHCVGAFARNRKGIPVQACDDSATSWCLLGAVRKVTEVNEAHESFPLYLSTVKYLAKALPGGTARFNDNAGYPAIRKFLRQQIKVLS